MVWYVSCIFCIFCVTLGVLLSCVPCLFSEPKQIPGSSLTKLYNYLYKSDPDPDFDSTGLFIRGGKGLKTRTRGLGQGGRGRGFCPRERALIGWHAASALSITECKQGSDWLLASPHWAA